MIRFAGKFQIWNCYLSSKQCTVELQKIYIWKLNQFCSRKIYLILCIPYRWFVGLFWLIRIGPNWIQPEENLQLENKKGLLKQSRMAWHLWDKYDSCLFRRIHAIPRNPRPIRNNNCNILCKQNSNRRPFFCPPRRVSNPRPFFAHQRRHKDSPSE